MKAKRDFQPPRPQSFLFRVGMRVVRELTHPILLHVRPWLEARRIKAVSVPGRPLQILAVQFGDLGDLILTGPFLRALRARYSKARIVLVVPPHTEALARGCPQVNEVVAFDFKGLAGKHWKEKTAGCHAWWKAGEKLRKRLFPDAPPDIALSIRTHRDAAQVASQILLATSHARRRVATPLKPLLGALHSDRLINLPVPPRGKGHEVEYQAEILSTLGRPAPMEPGPLEAWSTPEGRQEAEALWKILGTMTGPIIGLGIGAGRAEKCWPIAHFAVLTKLLEKEMGARVIVIGDEGDRAAGERVGGINLAGRLSLPALIPFLGKLSLFIGNDSGPVHLAAAAGIPVVALFGPEDPHRWAPWTVRKEVLQQMPLAELKPEQVLAAARRFFTED